MNGYKSLPGDWDRETLRKIELLGMVGDKSSLGVLEEMEKRLLIDVPQGKFGVWIESAKKKILKRQNM